MRHLILSATFAHFAATSICAAAPVVTNVWAAQIPGTHQVRIEYDLVAEVPCDIKVQFSLDGGAIYGMPLADDLIPLEMRKNVTPGNRASGTQKAITLTVAKIENENTVVKIPALHNQFTKNLRFKVVATPGAALPAPTGFAQIPAGSFQMGDQSNPKVGHSDETVHTVYVSAFYMARAEVTKAEWDAVRAWGLGHGYLDLAVGNGEHSTRGATHPVHSISWHDMVKWCNARSQMENLTPCYTVDGLVYMTGANDPQCNWGANGYRLPTESEWEKAARGGVIGRNFPWGDMIDHSRANYYSFGDYSYEYPKDQGYHPLYEYGDMPYTSPVGSFPPNGFGLYDMAGNVRELCWDWYGAYPPGSVKDPRGALSGSAKVYRSGSWGWDADGCRVSSRYDITPSNMTRIIGFRVARSSAP